MSLATLLDRNKAFATTDAVAENPQIPWLPHQLSYVITCIDSRTEPAAILCVDLGDATVQRVVGGRVTPAVLRDVAYISYLTETKTPDGPWWELAVIHHTDCGSTLLADPEVRRGFAERGGYVEAELAWLPATDAAATVRADVTTLVTAPQLSPTSWSAGTSTTPQPHPRHRRRPHPRRQALTHLRLPSSLLPRESHPPVVTGSGSRHSRRGTARAHARMPTCAGPGGAPGPRRLV